MIHRYPRSNSLVNCAIIIGLVLLLAPIATFAQTMDLTETERTFLREHPVIRVGFDSAWPPLDFADEQGAQIGVAVDYIAFLSHRLGVRLEPVTGRTWTQVLEGA